MDDQDTTPGSEDDGSRLGKARPAKGRSAKSAPIGARSRGPAAKSRTPLLIGAAVVVVLLVVAAVTVLGGKDDGKGKGGTGDNAQPTTTLAPATPNKRPFTFTSLIGGPSLDPTSVLTDGTIDVGVLPATHVVPHSLVVLADDRKASPAEVVVPVVRQDLVFPELQTSVTAVSKALTATALPGLVSLASTGAKPVDVTRGWLQGNKLLSPAPVDAAGPVRIGTTGDLDLQIVAQAYGQVLAAAKFDVTYVDAYADNQAMMAALGRREVDLVVGDVAGLVLGAGAPPSSIPRDPATLVAMVSRALAAVQGTALTPTDINRSSQFVMSRAKATELGVKELSDLAKIDKALKFGGPDQCLSDPSCVPMLQTSYSLAFAS